MRYLAIAAVLALTSCASLRPTQFTKASPPPVTADECWVLKRDGVWYDCRG